MTFKTLIGATAVALVTATGTASFADNKDSVTVFYDLLSDPSNTDLATAFLEVTSEDWESIGNYSGENDGRDAFLGQMGGFAQLMPDIEWAVQEMHEDGDTVIVRSRATATPVAPFFGVDGQGRSFDIMTIDIHQLEDGKIVRTYHVEDWATGLRQLAGQ